MKKDTDQAENAEAEAAVETLPNEHTKALLQEQRSSPYYVVFSVLFALVAGSLIPWIKDLAGAFRHEKAALTALNPGGLSSLPIYLQCMLVGVTFLLIVYLWLFFSRVFVLLKENSLGEAWSFVLCFAVLVTVCVVQKLPRFWHAEFAVCVLFIFAKVTQMRWSLRKADAKHPLGEFLKRWQKQSAWMLAGLIGCWFLCNQHLLFPFVALKPGYKGGNAGSDLRLLDVFYTGVVSIVAVCVLGMVMFVFPNIDKAVTEQMNKYLKSEYEKKKAKETEEAKKAESERIAQQSPNISLPSQTDGEVEA